MPAEAAAVRELHVRRAAAGDREPLTRMFDRCTRQTRYDRFHGHVNMLPDRYLTEALSRSPVHYALVAVNASSDVENAATVGAAGDHAAADGPDRHCARPHRNGADRDDPDWKGAGCAGPVADGDHGHDVIVALASCRAIAEGVAELGLLVEDRWQRHGVGSRLLRELIGYADHMGLRVLKAQILSEQAWITTLLRSYGTCHVARQAYGTLEVTLRLGQASPPPPSATAISRERP